MYKRQVPTGKWQDKGAATGFPKEEYYATLKKALRMEELVRKHAQIMERHDPAHRVGLIVDEWGTWYNVEPGTNPGFLYQQNTMRDAMVAALTLNIFNAHSDRVVMANLAQMVNVLQAVILTEGEKLVLTPTYHVFDLYKHHQDAVLLGSYAETGFVGTEGDLVPDLSVSASEDGSGVIHVTLANTDAEKPRPVELTLEGRTCAGAEGRILSGNMGDYNDFGAQDKVQPRAFSEFTAEKGGIAFTMPACSVLELSLIHI